MSRRYSIRFSDEQWQFLCGAADGAGRSVTDYIRMRLDLPKGNRTYGSKGKNSVPLPAKPAKEEMTLEEINEEIKEVRKEKPTPKFAIAKGTNANN